MPRSAGYYRHPTIDGDTIVFVCEDDLWTVPARGGEARRLTAKRGALSFPRFSPDGSLLAFTAREEGPSEVYVMEAAGGVPRRLTFQGATVRTVGWASEGAKILYQSNAERPFVRDYHLWEVPAGGGPPRRLPWGPLQEIAFQPDGPGVVLGRNSADPARWKRYRGGTAGSIWIDRAGGGKFRPLLELEGNLAAPMWIGSRIWFLSDHEGHGNLYSCTPAGRGLRRHTDHEDFYVRYPSTDGRRIVYHAGADLHVLDTDSGESWRIEASLVSPRTERQRRFVAARDHLESAHLHPQGHSLACVTRGAAFSFGLWEGPPHRHGKVSAERLRLARWLPDGERLVTVTDDTGEESLVVFRADGAGRRRRIEGDLGRVLELAPAPAGARRVAFSNHRQELWVADLASAETRRIEQSRHDRIAGLAWSPDGRWLAYGFPVSRRATCLHLLDTGDGSVHEITRPEFVDFAPAFDPAGRYLYFLSRRVFDPVYDSQTFDLGFPRGVVPCLLPLRSELPSPFDVALREPRRPRPKPDRRDEAASEEMSARVAVDLEGIAGRVVAFPVQEGRYERILGGLGRVFFSSTPAEGSLDVDWWSQGPPPAEAKLEVHDFERARTETVHEKVTDFGLSLDAQTLLVRRGNRLRALPARFDGESSAKGDDPGRESGWIDLARLRLPVEPEDEWRQMLREAWRLQRDHFWTPDMSRVDWTSVLERYLPLVERVGTRSEFSDLVWEMQGELGTSHCYEMGGDYLPQPEWHQGHLGADLEYDADARAWVIRRIPAGDSWDPKASSPLAAPGLDIREGDHLVAVGGERLSAKRSAGECLVDQAARQVVIAVRTPGARLRRAAVTTLRSETPLRYRDWVKRNRERVHEETNGRVGYIHVPDMGPRGYAEFHRSFFNEVDRPGLIVDVRWNGGGHVSQLLLEKLMRRRISYDVPRWSEPSPYPHDAPMGPMVALANELAGSDGDIFSHAFKLYGLGPLIGKRTWGGVIGIWPRHALVDGTITTQAEFSTWFTDVGWGVENYGTDPTIEVDITPQDHAVGRDTQLERALREIRRILREEKPTVPKLDRRPDRRPPRLARDD